MEAEEIIATASNDEQRPGTWDIFPLIRSKVLTSLVYWILGILMSGGLLALIIPLVIPYNYQRGPASIIFTTILLGLLFFLMAGCIWLLLADIGRLRTLDRYKIIITNETFVKQEGKKIIAVPLSAVHYVTLRGKRPVEPTSTESRPRVNPGDTMRNIFMVGGNLGRQPTPGDPNGSTNSLFSRKKRGRGPTSVAFLDTRTNKEVLVVNDDAYGDPVVISDVLKEHVSSFDK